MNISILCRCPNQPSCTSWIGSFTICLVGSLNVSFHVWSLTGTSIICKNIICILQPLFKNTFFTYFDLFWDKNGCCMALRNLHVAPIISFISSINPKNHFLPAVLFQYRLIMIFCLHMFLLIIIVSVSQMNSRLLYNYVLFFAITLCRLRDVLLFNCFYIFQDSTSRCLTLMKIITSWKHYLEL